MSPASYQTAPPRVAMESGKRDSNSRPQPWQGCALPTELFPRSVSVDYSVRWRRLSRQRRRLLDDRPNRARNVISVPAVERRDTDPPGVDGVHTELAAQPRHLLL